MIPVLTKDALHRSVPVTSPDLLRAMVDASPDAISVKDINLVYVACNATFLQVTGKCEKEVIGRSDLEVMSAHQAELCRHSDRHVLETGETVIGEEYVPGANGMRCFQVIKIPLRDHQGAIVGVVVHSHDISERKRAEQSGQLQADRYAKLLATSQEGFWIMGIDGTLRDVNQAFCTISGYPREELLGMHISRLEAEENPQQTASHIQQVIQQGFARFETRHRRKDDTIIDVEISTSYWSPSGDFLVFCRDITERIRSEAQHLRYEAELQAARQLAERESQAKTRFLATASHDLRQPIQAMHLLAHLLVNYELPSEAAEIAVRMQEAVDGLGEMLSALLDISKLDAGLVQPDLSEFSLGDLIRQLRNEHLPLAEEKGIVLRYGHSSVSVHSDLKLLTRILRNLISNAIKYTPVGKVLIGVRRADGVARIQILDTGIGIKKSEREKIFEEFHQLGNTARDRREGLGLGLAIVKRLSTLLGHPVQVDSNEGQGTCFTVQVPLAPGTVGRKQDTPDAQLELEIPYEGAEIFVVDDEVDIREGLAMSLRQWGYSVSMAADFEQAIAIVNKESPPVLIIADYRLGAKTGIDVIRELRKRCKRKISALLLTGDATEDRTREAARLDVRLLRKPVSGEKLRHAIVDCLRAVRTAR